MTGTTFPSSNPHASDHAFPSASSSDTHLVPIGYALWIFGFMGAHRFYYGRPITGTIWFFTAGLLGIGWIIDLFLIPSMNRQADFRYRLGRYDYNLSWILLTFLGLFGIHRFYIGKWITGIVYLLTGALFGLGWLYDLWTLNEQVHKSSIHVHRIVKNHFECPALMILARYFLECVREWTMTDVMKQCCGKDRHSLLCIQMLPCQFFDAFEKPTSHVPHANRMRESTMVCSRIDHVAHAKLLNASESLKLSRVNQLQQKSVGTIVAEGNDSVNCVADDF